MLQTPKARVRSCGAAKCVMNAGMFTAIAIKPNPSSARRTKNIHGCEIIVAPRVPIITDMIPKTMILRRPKNVLNAPSGTAKKIASSVKIDRAYPASTSDSPKSSRNTGIAGPSLPTCIATNSPAHSAILTLPQCVLGPDPEFRFKFMSATNQYGRYPPTFERYLNHIVPKT